MTKDEILDELNKLTAQVKDLIEGDSFDEGNGQQEYITSDFDKTIYLRAMGGYNSDVDILRYSERKTPTLPGALPFHSFNNLNFIVSFLR